MKDFMGMFAEILEKLESIEAKLDTTPKMWSHNCPAMGTERMDTEVGHECNWCGMKEEDVNK